MSISRGFSFLKIDGVRNFLSIGFMLLLGLQDAIAEVKAFPSAEGFGSKALGGRGGRVIEVTNLLDSGTGSLRACAESTGARTCVFRVSGTISLTKSISIKAANSLLTIAGQTAPGGGIQLKNFGIVISYGAHDVIVRHIRVRPGTDGSPQNINDCVGILIWSPTTSATTKNIIVDHVSLAWVCDDTLQVYGNTKNVTAQWSLVGEGLTKSDYVNNAGKGANSKGGLVGGGNMLTSFHHNMYIHTGSRNAYTKGGSGGVLGMLDWRNNIVYNWKGCQGQLQIGEYNENFIQGNDASVFINFVGNKYFKGPDSPAGCWLGQLGGRKTKIYIKDNYSPFCTNGCTTLKDMKFSHEESTVWNQGVPTYNSPAPENQFRSLTAFNAPPIKLTALSSLESVLTSSSKGVGAIKPVRDSLDKRLINEFLTRTGNLGRNGAPYPQLASGVPPVDKDHDGMPDSWEVAHGLNPNNASDGSKLAPNGYTNLENYLNMIAGDLIP